MTGQIIILNGAPRAGKSSIARAIQDDFNGVWINLGVDASKDSTPQRFQPGIGLRPGGERPELEPLVKTLSLALYESVAAHSRRDVNVVMDTTHHDHHSRPLGILSACAAVLRDLPVLFVGVHCPLDVIMERRLATWGRGCEPDGSIPAPVQRWQDAVHRGWTYDLDIDTSRADPRQCSGVIARRLATGRPGTAFSAITRSS